MSNNNSYEDELRDWRFEAPTREYLLERRVKELEQTVSRLEKELRFNKIEDTRNEVSVVNNLGIKNIGATSGTIGSKSKIVGLQEVLPVSPYKAD